MEQANNKKEGEYVFPSPTGKIIRYSNFCKRAWQKVVYLVKPNTTPYSCRDTFITEQVSKGIPTQIIAKWVDSSVGEIESKYLDMDTLGHILPK